MGLEMPKPPLIMIIFPVLAVLVAGCGSRPDGVTRQFYERLAAFDVDGMVQMVCEEERASFQASMGFLTSFQFPGSWSVEDFSANTEASDGTSAMMKVTVRFVHSQAGERSLSGRIRLVRERGEWCLSGKRDGFRSVQNTAEELFWLP